MDTPIRFKVILLGDSGVGKSCLLDQIVGKGFSFGYQETTSLRSCEKVLTAENVDPALIAVFWEIGGNYINLNKAEYVKWYLLLVLVVINVSFFSFLCLACFQEPLAPF